MKIDPFVTSVPVEERDPRSGKRAENKTVTLAVDSVPEFKN